MLPPAERPRFVMPAAVWRAYALACIPLYGIYLAMLVYESLRGQFNFRQSLQAATVNLGPALLLLAPTWLYIDWMDRRGFSLPRLLANHVGMAIVFVGAWHAVLYGLIGLIYGLASAEKARAMWFVWQGLWGMMMYWAVAGGFTAYRAIERARAEAAASAQAQALLARTELAALRNKLNPHFLFNTLHSIIALTRRDAASAERALLKFSDLLRHVLDAERNGSDQVALQQELDFTRDYLDLEALRLGPRLAVDWQIDERALTVAVPALSVQPLVENSIKHAFNPRSAPGRLSIAATVDDERQQLQVRVQDDGPGRDPQALQATPGLGLKTVARRLQLAFGERGGLQVDSRPGHGFAVALTIPLGR